MSESAIEYDDAPTGEAEIDAPTPEVEIDDSPETAEVDESESESPEEVKAEAEVYYPEFDPRQQEFINDRIVAPKIAELRQTQRDYQELQEKLKQLESRPVEQRGQQDGGPVVPPIPDIWEDNYEEKIAQRDQAIVERSQWQHQRQESVSQQEREAIRQQEQFVQSLHTRRVEYSKRATAMGISEKDLKVAGDAVHQMGIKDDVAMYIAKHSLGPAITVHLAKNLADLQAIQQLETPAEVGEFVADKIKPRLAKMLKRQAPPEPTETLRGSGVPPKQRGPEGASYE